MKKKWKRLSSKIAHKNPYYYVRQDKVIRPDGKQGEYFVVVRPVSVFIVAVNDKNEVYLIKLHRYTTGLESLEIPAGSSDGQNPLKAAKRELQEETGLLAKKWKLLGKFQAANGILNQIEYLYLATELVEGKKDSKTEEGITIAKPVPFRKALKLIRENKISDIQSVSGLLMAAGELGFLKKY